MANAQIGNIHGFAAAKDIKNNLLANVTADGANTVTVDDMSKIVVGASYDIVNKATGAVLATNRQITNLTSAGVATYSGGDVTAVAGTHGIYPVGGWNAGSVKTNLNGGPADGSGLDMDTLDTIDSMRTRLTAISGTIYTAARLNQMTVNDMRYAIRLNDLPQSIKQ